MSAGTKQPAVLVTGGSGYLGGSVVIALLKAGHVVRTTVRDLAREGAVRATLGRHAPTGQLTLYAANLLADTGWDAAAEGVEYVVHVASPMPVREYRGQDLVTPAREGTRRVLQAAQRAGVRHVVVTSSVVAATPPAAREAPTDETVWTDLSDKGISPYARSKTLAEQDAWAFARASGGLTLTTILPGSVQGPALGREVSGSLELPLRMLAGRVPLLPRVSLACVDTGDLAELHVRALTDPRARGERIIAASRPLWFRQMAELLKARFGEKAVKVSTREAPDWLIRAAAFVSADARFLVPDLGKQRFFSSAKAEAILGRPLRSSEDAVAGAAESLIACGAV